MWIYDLKTLEFLAVNEAAVEKYGYSREEFLKMTLRDIRPAEDVPRLDADVKKKRPALQHSGAWRHKLKDGRVIDVEIHSHTLDYAGRKAALVTALDITERKQAEEKYRSIFEGAVEGIFQSTPEGRFLTVNPALARMLGYDSPEDMLRSVTDISHQVYADPSRRKDFIRLLEEQGEAYGFEYEALRKDGSIVWVSENARVVRNAAGQPLYYEGNIQDISEKKRASRQRERLLDIINASLNEIYAFDRRTLKFQYVNRGALQNLGYTLEQMQQMTPLDIKPAFSEASFRALIRPLEEGRQSTLNFETVHRRADGSEYPVEVRLQLIGEGDESIFLAVIFDITERKQAEQALRQSEEKLQNIIRHSGSMFYSHTPDHVLTYVSPQSRQILDCEPEEAMVRWQEFLSDNPANLFGIEATERAIQTGQRQPPYELELVTRKGRKIWVRVDESPVVENGKTAAIVGSLTDITERKRHERELEAEAMLAQALGETLEFQPLLERLLEAARHAIPVAEKGSLALLSDSEHLQVHAISGYKDSSVLGFTYPVTWGYAGRALREHRSMLIADVQTDPELQEDTQQAPTAEVQALRSAMAVPLLAHESALGVLSLESTRPNAFNEEDLRLLTNFATSAALIVERARLFEETDRRARENAALLTTSRALNSLNLQDILKTIGERAKSLFNADGCRVFLLEPDGETLRCVLALLENPAAFSDLKIKIGEGVTGSVARSGQAEIVNDMNRDPRAISVPGTEEEPEAIMFAPLKEQERVIGVISIRRVGHDRPFQPADLELLKAFASLAASAVSNARLFEETRQQTLELKILYESGLTLGRLLTPKEIGQKIIELLEEKMGWSHAVIRLYHKETDRLEVLAFNQPGIKDEQERRAIEEKFNTLISKPGDGLSGWAVQHRQPVRCQDVTNDPHYIETYPSLRSGLYIPMMLGERVIGVISIESETANAFSEADERLAMTLAAQAAIALENARLFEETRQRMREQSIIHQASQALLTARLNPQAVYESMREAVSRVMPCEAFSIVLEDESRGDYHAVYLYDLGTTYPPRRIPRGTGLSGRVISEGQTLFIHDNWKEEIPAVHFGSPQAVRSILAVPLRKDDQIVGMVSTQSYQPNAFNERHRVLLETLAAQMATAIENARLFEETRQRAAELETINRISIALRAVTKQDEMLAIVLEETLAALNAQNGLISLLDEQSGCLVTTIARGWPSEFAESPIQAGEGVFGKVFASGNIHVTRDFASDPLTLPESRERLPAGWGGACVPIRTAERALGVMLVAVPSERELGKNEIRLLNTLAEMTGSALHRMRLHEETLRRAEEFESLYKTNAAIASQHNLPAVLQTIVNRATSMLNASGGGMYLYDPASGELEIAVATHPSIPMGIRLKFGEGAAGRVAQSRQPLRVDDYSIWEGRAAAFQNTEVRAVLEVPMLFGGDLIGVLVAHEIGDSTRKFTQDDERLLSLFAAQAAAAIRSARLREQTIKRMEHLQALREVDRVIASSFDLEPILNTVLSHTISQLNADAADVLLFRPALQTLEYAAGVGFRTRNVERAQERLGEGWAGMVAMERRLVHIPNLRESAPIPRASLLADDNFLEYYGVPLISKGEVKGVLEVFHRSPLAPKPEWLGLLETLAGQAAIAIDNVQLFDKLQRSNLELAVAYDATIEGWSRAMDLRDEETEGHTQRVTEKALLLAQALGMSGEELLHLRRGALLHDIGKIGVPDHILLKSAPLTEEEWAIMRKHPLFAYEMLRPISYLRASLDIPYCHHEKWDGTGYPQGLKGEQIPLAARIFAVVDAFDALTSDRPYRKAWTKQEALNYIREQSGKHFDPQVVEKFLELFGKEK